MMKLLWFIVPVALASTEVDPNGYIAFCPCMGRFGNQADHYLGAMGFAKGLNRTLILPPFVEYKTGQPKSVQVPFSTYFSLDAISEYHRVIPMDVFMKTIALTIWPPEKRISFCYTDRIGEDIKGCNAKQGNPFGPFWDTFDIGFVGSETYGPLHYDVHNTEVAEEWNKRYPPTEWPVLAFTGAPASFPVQPENIDFQKYLIWNERMQQKAETFIKESLPKGPFVGIHLRNGIDWERACEYVDKSPSLFSAPQCLGYRNERGSATKEMCLPSEEMIVRQIRRAVNKTKATSVFVASDHDHLLERLSSHFKHGLAFRKLPSSDPHLDLAILGRANHFIGNCISSFSAFVKRERDVKGFPSSFWGFPTEKRKRHEEL